MPSVCGDIRKTSENNWKEYFAPCGRHNSGLYRAPVASFSGGGLSGRPREEFRGDDDRRMLQRHLNGEPEAFGELLRRHGDRLWAVALRTLGNPEDAADAVQEAMISAYRRAGSYRGEAAVTTWLHRIVVNACLDHLRRRAVRPVQPLSADRADPTLSRDPIEDRQIRLDVVEALAGLPVDQRLALVLVDIEGYPVAEAARILGVPAGTVKSRCARGRARLAGALASYRNRSRADGVGSKPVPDGASGQDPEEDLGR